MTSDKQRYTLPRSKSLKSKILIDALFKKGDSLIAYPLRLVYLPVENSIDENFLVAFSVPKKKFKRAVDRNRIKRLMRESFRLQQHHLQLPKKTVMMWIFIGKDIPDYKIIYQKMEELIVAFNQK